MSFFTSALGKLLGRKSKDGNEVEKAKTQTSTHLDSSHYSQPQKHEVCRRLSRDEHESEQVRTQVSTNIESGLYSHSRDHEDDECFEDAVDYQPVERKCSEQESESKSVSEDGEDTDFFQEKYTFRQCREGNIHQTNLTIKGGYNFLNCGPNEPPSDSDSSDDDTPEGTWNNDKWKSEVLAVGNVNDLDEELLDLLRDVNDWTEDSDLKSNCTDYLHQLSQCVENTMIRKGNYDFWVNILAKDRNLANFFLKITQLDGTNFETVRYFLNKLIKPTGQKRFLNCKTLRHWLRASCRGFESGWDFPEINSLVNLHLTLKNDFLPRLRETESTSNFEEEIERERFETAITDQMAVFAKSLHAHLLKDGEKESIVFLNVLLRTLSYNCSSGGFEILITIPKLEEFIEVLVTSLEDYQNVYGSPLNRQLFLIKNAISSCQIYGSHRTKEKVFMNILDPISKSLDQRISKIFNDYTSESPFDFISLSNDLQRLVSGEEMLAECLNLSRLHQVLTTKTEKQTEGDPSVTIHNDLQKEIITTFSLEKYFPSKIELQDVMKIQRILSDENAIDVPWIILQRLIMLDNRGRDHTLSNFFAHSPENSAQVSGDLESFIGDTVAKRKNFNPQDMFVTIFSCCSPVLKQILVQKMFLCQLAVPFLYQPLLTDTFHLSMWPLRSLRSEGSTVPIAKDSTTIASFIRIKRPLYSKSELLSNVLSDQGQVFHNHKCFLGETEKVVSEGSVEASWYIPSKENAEDINGLVTCLNLRGDMLENQKQASFLRDISDILFILVDASHILDPTVLNPLLDLYTSDTTIVLLLTSEVQMEELRAILKEFNEQIGENKSKTKLVKLTSKGEHTNFATVKRDIKEMIKCLGIPKARRLVDCVKEALSHDIAVDESENDCMFAKKLATEVISSIEPGTTLETFLKQNFPLQGTLLDKLAKTLRQQSKIEGKSTMASKECIVDETKRLRIRQVNCCQNLSAVMHRFIEAIIAHQDSNEILMMFFVWLSVLLDERFSEELSESHKESFIENKNFERIPEFDMGYFIREIGQIYESVIAANEVVDETILEAMERLPRVIAKLLLYGQAIEIMDGDHSNIPLYWVKAVFANLEKLTGDAKILVVSVVGIQSSGKSTLANAMFGLQFNVSAGRCSKGVFMQMMPVERSQRKEYGYDYIVVLDSEGLRSQEISATEYDKDHKLATFVIGMSDVCLVNNKGEICTEMRDVLQIVVYAFLRLKIANDNLRLRQTCVFIHQNVSAPDADEKTKFGRSVFVDSLNEVTKIAAEQEGYPDTTMFNQIIEFDHKQHCWFFKDFWNGNPPMAAVNPIYSDNVNAVRNFITKGILARGRFLMNISDLSEHTEDLWNGILSDQLIYSFKNCIEVKAYNILEMKSNNLQCELESSVYRLIKKVSVENVKWHKTTDANQQNIQELLEQLRKNIKGKVYETKRELEAYIESSDFREVFLTWKQAKLVAINKMFDSLMEKAKQQLTERQDQLRLDAHLSKMKKELLKEIADLAKAFYEDLSVKDPTEEQLDDGFEDIWRRVLHKRAARQSESPAPIEKIMSEKMHSHFRNNIPLLEKELKKSPLLKTCTDTSLEGSITINDIAKDHIRIKRQGLMRKKVKSRDQCNLQTVSMTDNIFGKIDTYLDDLSYMDTKFDESFVNKLLSDIDEEISAHNEKFADQQGFSILISYKVKLCVHVCSFAHQRFQAMNESYESKHNTRSWCETQKGNQKEHFKSIVHQKTEENLATSMFCECLEEALFKSTKDHIRCKTETYMLNKFSNSKSVLLQEIYLYLLEQSDFKSWESYIDNPYQFSFSWITQNTRKSLKEKGQNKLSLFSEMSLSFIAEVKQRVEASLMNATEELSHTFGKKPGLWLQKFRDGIKDHILIETHKLKDIEERRIFDFQGFQDMILAQLGHIQERVSTNIENAFQLCLIDGNMTVYKSITDRLWGCPALCPLCNEPCRHTVKEHVTEGLKHSCIQHRPLALKGVRETDDSVKDGILVVDPCCTLVRISRSFKCSWCNNECQKSTYIPHTNTLEHSFCNVQSIFPDWEIKASSKIESYQFWCYVTSQYSYCLKRKYGSDVKIPRSWKSVKQKDARKSLLKSSKIKPSKKS